MDRASYDRWWGLLLLFTCFVSPRAGEAGWLYHVVAGESDPLVVTWLIVGSLAGAVAFCLGLSRWASRWRHFVNLAMGMATLALPLLSPAVWERFPYTNPARLPLSDLKTIGWVMLVGFGALYAGSGVRIVRPNQPLGQVMGGMGAFLLFVFAFLPAKGGDAPYAVQRLALFSDFAGNWSAILAFALFTGAIACGAVNLLRSRFEVILAQLTRLLLVAGLLVWIALPFVVRGAALAEHQPVAWGTLRFLAPLFLAVDGTVAFVTISVTRS